MRNTPFTLRGDRAGSRIVDVLVVLGAVSVAHGAWLFFDLFSAETDWLIHYRWATDFAAANATGTPLPSWAPSSRGGLGDPVFLYYMPLFYGLTALADTMTGEVWTAIKLVTAVAAAVTGWSLLRFALQQGLRPGPARALACLAIGLPFFLVLRGYINGYPWFVANTFLLAALIFLVRYLETPTAGRAAAIAVATGLCCLTHTLTSASFLLVAGVALVLDWVVHDRSRAGFARVTSAGAALALGVGAAAVAVLPAVGYLPLVSPEAWDHVDPRFSAWFNSFVAPLVTPSARGLYSWVMPAGTLLLVPAIAAAAVLRARPLSRPIRALLWIAAVALFLCTELSWPLWSLSEELQLFQRPFRFLSPLTFALLLAGTLLLAGLQQHRAWRWIARGTFAVTAVALLPSLAILADTARDALSARNSRDAVAQGPRMEEIYGQPEHLPVTAGPGWRDWLENGGWDAECAAAAAECETTTRTAHRHVWTVSLARPAALRLPLMGFPGWQVEVGGAADTITRIDPESGLIAVDLPAGGAEIVATWQPLPLQVAGRVISAVSIAAILALAASALLGARRGGRAGRGPRQAG